MIVIEVEDRKFGKSMSALSKIKEYVECVEEMLEEHAMSNRGSMSRRKDTYEEYESRKPRREYEDEYNHRYM